MTVSFFFGRIFSGGSKNIAGQTTVPLFSGRNFFSDCNWCLYFDINTNYGTYNRKKKVQSSGRLCFLNHQKKLRPEKRYSHLTDGWNKSQITVCCVTPITTGKNYDRNNKRYVRYSRLVICCVKIRTPPITLQFKKILIGFLYFTETIRSKLSVTVYLFLALYGSTTIQ